MQYLRNCFISSLIFMLLPLTVTVASVNPEQEIQHLFNFIVASDCTFIRNDTEYTVSEARDHMQKNMIMPSAELIMPSNSSAELRLKAVCQAAATSFDAKANSFIVITG